MPAAITDKFSKTFNSVNPNVARVNASRSSGVTTLSCDNLAGWPTDTVVHFSTYQVGTGGTVTSGTQIDWIGIVTGNSIGSLTRVAGATDNGSAINDIVEMNPTGSWANKLMEGLLVQHKQDGSHGAITADSMVTSGNVTIGGTLTIGGSGSGGWDAVSGTISAVVANGNRSYSLTTSNDNSALITPGMRLRTTRTVLAPDECTSLNGTSQYWNDTSVSGMTFTDDFVAGAWVKLSSYAASGIVSRYNGTSGFYVGTNASGQVHVYGHNAGAGNFRGLTSYQSLPLNKWVHITAQMDMSAYTATATTCYIMFDGVDVPATLGQGGTNPTALVQAGNLEIGSQNGASFFPGKIAQAFVAPKITQANIRTLISQGLTSALITTHGIYSAYSFDGVATDLNTTSANNLTAQGSAVATNADSPFGGNANGTISSILDYGIVQKVTSSTLTLQVAEGCTIPTSGGVASASYSSLKSPYGFPGQVDKWQISTTFYGNSGKLSAVATTWYGDSALSGGGLNLNLPLGSWNLGYDIVVQGSTAGASFQSVSATLSTSTTTETDKDFSSFTQSGSGLTIIRATVSRFKPVSLSNSTMYYVLIRTDNSTDIYISNVNNFPSKIIATNAYL